MNRVLCCALALMPAAALSAQIDKAEAIARLEAQAQTEYDQLAAEYAAVVQEFSAARRKLSRTDDYKKLRAAGDREGIAKLLGSIPQVPTADFIVKFQDGAERFAGRHEAVPFLTWIAFSGLSDKDAQNTAVETLVQYHLQSPKLLSFATGVGRLSRALGQERVDEIIDSIVAQNPNDLIKAHALYARASSVQRDRKASAEAKAAAMKDIDRIVQLAAGTPLAMRAMGPKFQAERLQIGMVAPDIEGVDLDQVAFNLSDYRGKVVVIDFWGDW